MPVDHSKPHPDRRRANRDAAAGVRQDGMYSREIEMKRNRGEISCAECRRCVRDRSNPLCYTSFSICLPRRTILLILAFFSLLFSPLGLRLSVTSKSPVNHVKYVPRNMPHPGEFASDLEHKAERVCLFVSEWSVFFFLCRASTMLNMCAFDNQAALPLDRGPGRDHLLTLPPPPSPIQYHGDAKAD
jgi:hypothetical protein